MGKVQWNLLLVIFIAVLSAMYVSKRFIWGKQIATDKAVATVAPTTQAQPSTLAEYLAANYPNAV
jgi:hypothetical protein